MENKYFNTPSPAFSKFRELMDQWDKHCIIEEQEKNAINDLLNKHGLSLFFKKGDDLYGSTEDGRITFAKLKANDEDDPMMPGFRDQARFIATNLLKAMIGDQDDSVENMFGLQDIPHIQICDREDAVKALMNPPKKKKNG